MYLALFADNCTIYSLCETITNVKINNTKYLMLQFLHHHIVLQKLHYSACCIEASVGKTCNARILQWINNIKE